MNFTPAKMDKSKSVKQPLLSSNKVEDNDKLSMKKNQS